MTETIRIPGTYEIWRQKRGRDDEFFVSVCSEREATKVLDLLADYERFCGYGIEDAEGGFSAYIKVGKVVEPFVHYWFEEVIPDYARIDTALTDAIAVARTTAAAEVRQAETDAQADYRRSET